MWRLWIAVVLIACGSSPTSPDRESCPPVSTKAIGSDWVVEWYRSDRGIRCEPVSCVYLGQVSTMSAEIAQRRCIGG